MDVAAEVYVDNLKERAYAGYQILGFGILHDLININQI